MSLQRATTIALLGLSFLLIVSLVNWALLSLNLMSYFDNVRLFKLIQLLIILLQSVPLMIFLFILRKSQH